MNRTKKRNIIIGILCTVLLLMVVGYAAFQSALKINGTTTISSNWNIAVTQITSTTLSGDATNAEEPTGVGTLTATFKTNLVSPGDSMKYDITVTNSGTLPAKLEKLTVSKPNNDMITFETSGIEEGSTLTAGGTATLTIKVTYKDIAEGQSQPESTEGSLNITLDYVQDEGSSGPIIGPAGDDDSPKTVYAYHTDAKTIGVSVLTETEYKTDYTQIEGYNEATRPWFFKYDIDESGLIQNAYVCQKYSFIEQPLCLQGASYNYYNDNKDLLESLQPTFESNGGNCSSSTNSFNSSTFCINNGLRVSATSDGAANANYPTSDSNPGCFIDKYGKNIKCIE